MVKCVVPCLVMHLVAAASLAQSVSHHGNKRKSCFAAHGRHARVIASYATIDRAGPVSFLLSPPLIYYDDWVGMMDVNKSKAGRVSVLLALLMPFGI